MANRLTLLATAFLVMVVVFTFLRRGTPTLAAGISVPLALAGVKVAGLSTSVAARVPVAVSCPAVSSLTEPVARPVITAASLVPRMLTVIVLVLQFRSSGALAAAYGIAVSGTMIITTLLTVFILLVYDVRGRIRLLLAMALFGSLELLFFGSNLTKLGEGGWMPMALGAGIFLMLTTTYAKYTQLKITLPVAKASFWISLLAFSAAVSP